MRSLSRTGLAYSGNFHSPKVSESKSAQCPHLIPRRLWDLNFLLETSYKFEALRSIEFYPILMNRSLGMDRSNLCERKTFMTFDLVYYTAAYNIEVWNDVFSAKNLQALV